MSVDLTGAVIIGGVFLAVICAAYRPDTNLRIAACLSAVAAVAAAVASTVAGEPYVARFVLGVLPWGLFGLAAGEAGRRAEDRP